MFKIFNINYFSKEFYVYFTIQLLINSKDSL